jgi:hypothetical protein
MTRQEAAKILKDYTQKDGSLLNYGDYVGWDPGEASVQLDGYFSPEFLKAVAWWVENTPPTPIEG